MRRTGEHASRSSTRGVPLVVAALALATAPGLPGAPCEKATVSFLDLDSPPEYIFRRYSDDRFSLFLFDPAAPGSVLAVADPRVETITAVRVTDSPVSYQFGCADPDTVTGCSFEAGECTVVQRRFPGGALMGCTTFQSGLPFGGVQPLHPESEHVIVADLTGNTLGLGRYAPDGTEIWQRSFTFPYSPSGDPAVDPYDGDKLWVNVPVGDGRSLVFNLDLDSGSPRFTISETLPTLFPAGWRLPEPGSFPARSVVGWQLDNEGGASGTMLGIRDPATGALTCAILEGMVPEGQPTPLGGAAELPYVIAGRPSPPDPDAARKLIASFDRQFARARVVGVGQLREQYFGTHVEPVDGSFLVSMIFRDFGLEPVQKVAQFLFDQPESTFRAWALDRTVTGRVNFDLLCPTPRLAYSSGLLGAPHDIVIGAGMAGAEEDGLMFPIDEGGEQIPNLMDPHWQIEAVERLLTESFTYEWTPEVFAEFYDPNFRETRVRECQMVPDDGNTWAPAPAVLDCPPFIPPPTAGPIVIEQLDNSVKVILRRTFADKFYDLIAGDLEDWEVIEVAIPGTGGEVSIIVPIDRPKRFFTFEEHE